MPTTLPVTAERINSLGWTGAGHSTEHIPGIPELWRETRGDPQICIALLDGAVDLSHSALQGAEIRQHDTLGRAGQVGTLSREHGTHIASIIFGRHQGPVKGVAPDCRGVVIPIYQDDGVRVSCSQKDLAKAINEAIRLGAHVINISGGQLSPDGIASGDLRLAVRNCVQHDRLIVAAGGNDGCAECLHVPGRCRRSSPWELWIRTASRWRAPIGETSIDCREFWLPAKTFRGPFPGEALLRGAAAALRRQSSRASSVCF